MAHLSDGVLRRMYDEPLAITELARGHYNSCDACQRRFSEIADGARSAQAALAAPPVTVDAEAAFRSVAGRAKPSRLRLLPRLHGRRVRAVSAAALVAAALVGAAFVSPLAENLTTLFSPQAVQPVAVQPEAFAGMPDLSHWGTVKVVAQPELSEAGSAAEAAGRDLPVLPSVTTPSGLPAPTYARFSRGEATFTFDAARAQQAAGPNRPAVPARLNGKVLDVSGGPGEAAVYGSIDPKQVSKSQIPPLVVAVARAPQVTSPTGTSVAEIKAALKEAGVPQASLDAIGDPSSVLPIPIPPGARSDSPLLADGKTRAVYVGDNTRIAAALIWIHDDPRLGKLVYVVAGSQDEPTLLKVANALVPPAK